MRTIRLRREPGRRLAFHQMAGEFDSARQQVTAEIASRRSSDAEPISRIGICIVVSGGFWKAACGRSSMPMTETSSGTSMTRLPDRHHRADSQAVAGGEHGGEIEATRLDTPRDRFAPQGPAANPPPPRPGRRPPGRALAVHPASLRSDARWCAARAASGTGCAGGRGRADVVAKCAAERLHGVTLEWCIAGSSPLISTIGLPKPPVSVSTPRRRASETGSRRRSCLAWPHRAARSPPGVGDRARHQLDDQESLRVRSGRRAHRR